MGDLPGHPFRGNQYTMPGDESAEERGRYYYHATPAANVESIRQRGVVKVNASVPISIAPHIKAVKTWAGLIGAKDMAVLRVKRMALGTRSLEKSPGYRERSEGAELATYRDIHPTKLEVHVNGRWERLALNDWEKNPAKVAG